MSSSTYRRVPVDESDDGLSVSQHQRRSLSDRMQDKFFAALWVLVAAAVASASHFYRVVTLHDSRVNIPLMQLALIGISVNVALFAYLTIYLPRCKGLTDSSAWEVYCPRVFPSMTFISFVTFLLLTRATWPIWGFLAPLILGTQVMGALFALHFVPWPF